MTTENSLKMMENAFWFTLKFLSVLKIFTFCPDFLGRVRKLIDKKTKPNLKIYDVTNWEINNYSTYVVKYLKKRRQPDHEVFSVYRI